MKTYTITVEIEEQTHKLGLLDELLGEIQHEEDQLKITRKINTATMGLHMEILKDVASQINRELEGVGLRFDDFEFSETDTNCYRRPMCRLVISDFAFILFINATSDRGFKESKYVTYTGDYSISLLKHEHPWHPKVSLDTYKYSSISKSTPVPHVWQHIKMMSKNIF